MTIQLSERLKSEIMTIPNAGKDSEKLDFSYIAGWNVKGYNLSGK